VHTKNNGQSDMKQCLLTTVVNACNNNNCRHQAYEIYCT